MTDLPRSDADRADDAPQPEPPFRRRWLRRGYDRAAVARWYGDTEQQLVELRTEVMDANDAIADLDGQLREARREVRFWNDRASFVEGEVARVREVAARVEADARDRAAASDAAARQHALQVVDRAVAEAGALLRNAREEAREIMARYEGDLELEQRRVERMTALQLEIGQSMRAAVTQFEQGMRELDRMAPSAQQAGSAPRPVRRTPTFGRTRAIEAAGDASTHESGDAEVEDDATVARMRVISAPLPGGPTSAD